MKRIQYKVTIVGGDWRPPSTRGTVIYEGIVTVFARSINSGFTKAVKRARGLAVEDGTSYDVLHRIEFWQVTS